MSNSKSEAKNNSRPKTFKPKVLDSSQQQSFKSKAQRKEKSFMTNKKGPIKIRVPRNEIVYISGMTCRITLDSILTSGEWIFTKHDGRNACAPSPNIERERYREL